MRVDAGPETELRDGVPKCVTINGRQYALFRLGGTIHCLDNRCTHLGGPLCQGSLRGSVVTCPWHGSRFDISSGQVVGPPARVPVRSYPAQVEAGRILVELE